MAEPSLIIVSIMILITATLGMILGELLYMHLKKRDVIVPVTDDVVCQMPPTCVCPKCGKYKQSVMECKKNYDIILGKLEPEELEGTGGREKEITRRTESRISEIEKQTKAVEDEVKEKIRLEKERVEREAQLEKERLEKEAILKENLSKFDKHGDKFMVGAYKSIAGRSLDDCAQECVDTNQCTGFSYGKHKHARDQNMCFLSSHVGDPKWDYAPNHLAYIKK